MAIDYPAILALEFPEERWAWTSDQCILYAVAVGVPPLSDDPAEQRFIHRRLGPEVLPSFLSVAGASGQLGARRLGIDRSRRLHGAQSLTVHGPAPLEGVAITQVAIEECLDKGDSGAVIVSRAETFDAQGRHLATTKMTSFARGEGHFGGPRGAHVPTWTASRPEDIRFTVPMTSLAPILFGLIRDRNPLHTDPEAALRSGFARPVIHGLCLFGIACRLAITRIPQLRGLRLVEQHVRFAGPVHADDILDFSFWIQGLDLRFVAHAREGRRLALSHGHIRFADDDI